MKETPQNNPYAYKAGIALAKVFACEIANWYYDGLTKREQEYKEAAENDLINEGAKFLAHEALSSLATHGTEALLPQSTFAPMPNLADYVTCGPLAFTFPRDITIFPFRFPRSAH